MPKERKVKGENGAVLSKTDAVRDALDTLGPDTGPTKLQEHIQKTHGIEIPTNNISALKSNILKKTGVKKKGRKGRRKGSKNKSKMSKRNAVRKALATLGRKAMPLDIQTFIQKEFGIAMNTGMISSYKTSLRKTKRSYTKRDATTVAAPHQPSAKGYSRDSIRAVIQLAERIGAREVKEIAEILIK